MGPGALKPLRLLAGRPLVAHVVDGLRPQVMDLVIVANDSAPEFRALDVPVIPDPTDVQEAAQREGRRLGPLAGILGFEARPLVSADYADDSRSAIIDGPSTLVTDGTLLKVYAWYDNEMGYACRMVDLATIVIQRGI